MVSFSQRLECRSTQIEPVEASTPTPTLTHNPFPAPSPFPSSWLPRVLNIKMKIEKPFANRHTENESQINIRS